MTESQYEFDRATALTARPGAPGVYEASIDPGWVISGAVNGGFLLSLAGRALGLALGTGAGPAEPVSVTGHFVSASRPGPAAVRTEVIRRGRSLSTGTAAVLQRDDAGREVERLRVLATYGPAGAAADAAAAFSSAAPPDLPPPDRCVGRELTPPELRAPTPLYDRLDLRLDPDTVGWALGAPAGRGTIRGWVRLADGREPDPLLLLMAADVLPPVTFDLGLPGWAPTVELTVHVRARPVKGWLRVTHTTRTVADGLFEEDAEIWDESDRLVAQSRQLARTPRTADIPGRAA